MKKLLLLSILILLLFVLFGCKSDEPNKVTNIEQPAVETISEPITQPESVTQVYEQPIVLNEISFTFEGRKVEPCHAERVDAVRIFFLERFNMHRRPSSVVFTTNENTKIGINYVRLNPDDPRSLGAVFHFIAGGVPAWLNAGIELYYANELGVAHFDIYGDIDAALERLPQAPCDGWFVRGVLSGYADVRDDALTILYHFIAYLENNDYLTTMFMSYLTNETTAEELRTQAWLSFSGLELDNSTIYRYRYDLYESEFTVFTERGRYTFAQAGYWMDTPIHEDNKHIELLDNGIEFAFEFFGIEQTELVPFSLFPHKHPGSAVGMVPSGRNLILMWDTLNTMSIAWATTHEVVHYITQRYFPSPFADWMEEGLATAIGFIHASGDDVFRAYLIEKAGANENNWQPLAAREALLQLSGANIMQDICPIAILNFDALWLLTYFEENNEYFPHLFRWPHGGRPSRPQDRPEGVLYCYTNSGSFAMFLLEIGTLEDYMQLRSNRDAAQELYGMSFHELIEMWKYEHLQFYYWRVIFSEFLMEYIENVLYFMEQVD